MKYYSEELNKLFDSEDELLEAEYTVKKAAEEAEAAAKAKAIEKENKYKEVKAAFDLAAEARDNFMKLQREYVEEYGSFRLKTNHSINPFWMW